MLAQNGQGWPKFALRSVFTTADGGVAVSLFNPIRAELGAGAVLVVDTEHGAQLSLLFSQQL